MNSCEKCGSLVPAEKAFCPNCGAAMIAERQRVPEDSGEMGETIYDAPTGPKPELPKPTPTPVNKAQASTAPPAPTSSTPRPTAARTTNAPKVAPVNAPASGDNRSLRMILGAAAALFVITILVIAILYVMGKI